MKIKRKYYIAYGSNLNKWQMTARCPDAIDVGTAELEGWRLAYRGSKSGAYLTIIPDKRGTVPVAIWAVSQQDEKNLDRYEGYPSFYRKKIMTVHMRKRDGEPAEVKAFVYLMHADSRPGIPSLAYQQTCMIGYRHFGFSPVYLQEAYNDANTELMRMI